MKILQMPAYFLPCKGGIEYAVYYISQGLIKLGHDVKVITSKTGCKEKNELIDMSETALCTQWVLARGKQAVSEHAQKHAPRFSTGSVFDNIKVKRINAFQFMKSPFAPFLLSSLSKEKPDIIHLHYPHPFFIDIGAFFARQNKIPYIVHSHGNEISLRGWKNIFARTYNRIFFNHALKHADAIITNTSKVIPQSIYLQKYKNKIYTIPHGIDLKKFNRVETELKEQLGFQNCKIIMFAGALRQYKGLTYLIKSISIIKNKIPQIRLIIIGRGDKEKELYSLVKQLSLEQYVLFQGFVEQDKLLEFYSIADLFVLPSPTIEESFGMVAFEALAMKVPCIVTSGCGVSEVFEREKIDTIVEPRNPKAIAEKCIELLNNNKLRKELALFGRKKMEFYSWDIIAKQYLEVYNKALRWKHT